MRETTEGTTDEEFERLLDTAAAAAEEIETGPRAERMEWLRSIADRLDSHAAELIPLADSETHLGEVRLTSELARTTGQLRLFADVLAEGSYLEAAIDHADVDAVPPRPDLRRMLLPVGPVAMFSASNFPFAFSVAGGDTAAALAAGCPVIVKAHPGHPALSALTGQRVAEALARAGAPAGVFGLAAGHAMGGRLVADPVIKAVAFTGSLAGGRALFDIAVSRPDPIPFYGELGSLNPVVISPKAARARGESLARGLVQSFTLGGGQFCTKPGLVFVPAGSGFEQHVAGVVTGSSGQPLLTERIGQAFSERVDEMARVPGVTTVIGNVEQSSATDPATPVVLSTTVATALAHADVLLEECFGPTTVVIGYSSLAELVECLQAVEGSLTATLHSEPDEDLHEVFTVLRRKAGRVLFDGWPTGVAVAWAQHHGGPWPATTSLHTSVGATSIRRFLRPIAFQDAPEVLLPPELRESNPLGIPRRIDGALRLPIATR